MIRLAAVMISLSTTSVWSQETPDWPPPPGPICGDIESSIPQDNRYHESEITRESYEWALETFRETLPIWIAARAARGGEALGGETQMAWHNALLSIDLYVLRLEFLSASDSESEEARSRFCEALGERVIWD